jgi:hypothetical protein
VRLPTRNEYTGLVENWHDLFENLNALAVDFDVHRRQAREIATGSRKARGQPHADRVGMNKRDDRN